MELKLTISNEFNRDKITIKQVKQAHRSIKTSNNLNLHKLDDMTSEVILSIHRRIAIPYL